MAEDAEPDLKLEIAHILTIDVVAYSTLLIHEQSLAMAELNRAVRNTPRFRAAETEGKLTRLPTGDGMALVFHGDPEAPIECAMQIAAELKGRPEIQLRMGIHSGPIKQILDVNDRSNVAGAGIDLAQRVMDCGDAGHILVSKRVADDLSPYSKWNQHLHELGECEVKHGRKISLYNFYREGLGNPQLPGKLRCVVEARKNSQAAVLRRRRSIFALLACGVLAASLAVAFWPRTTKPSIAVLPFLDLSQNRDQEYFSDGIADQIINSLGKIHGLLVVARSSSFAFKHKEIDARIVGKTLGVTHLVEGSVSRGPEMVRVDAHLIDVNSGYQLWAESYNSSQKDALSLQSDVATKVARALALQLQPTEKNQLAKLPTQNVEANNLYLQGRYQLNKRTPEAVEKGLELFQLAVAKDSQFALAHADVADAYILLGKLGAMPGEEAAKLAWPEVTGALAIDDQLAEGYVSRAILLNDFEWNWPAAEADYEKALSLNPNSAAAHYWYARHLEQLGRSEEALSEIAAALRNDPLSPTSRVAKGKILFTARRYPEAIDACKKALELEPNFASAYQVLGQSYAHSGEIGKAIDAAKKYVELSAGNGWSLLELAYVYAVGGNRSESDKIVHEVTGQVGEFSPYDMATIRSAWRDADGSIPWLEKAIQQRSVDVILMRSDPRLDNVRGDPRFKVILEHIVPRR